MLTVIRGHVSPETAYVVDDYPFGFRLRCKIRYWLEKADKGSKKGQYRLMSQTTNPKKPGEYWNKPKASTYNAFAVMTKDESNGHIGWDGLYEAIWPEHYGAFYARVGSQLNLEEATELHKLVLQSRRLSPRSWEQWEEDVADVKRCLPNYPDDYPSRESAIRGSVDALRIARGNQNPIYESTFRDAYAFAVAFEKHKASIPA